MPPKDQLVRLAAASLMVLATEQAGYAYTDPGSGMLIMQLLGSAALGALFYFQKVRCWVAGLFRGNKPEQK